MVAMKKDSNQGCAETLKIFHNVLLSIYSSSIRVMASEKDKVMLNQDSKYTHLCDHHKTQMEGCSNAYSELLTELFFLQHGGNYIDFVQFKKRPSEQLCDHIRQNPIISYESEKHKNLQDTTETLPIHSNEEHTSLPTSAPKVETPYRQNVLSIEKNQSSVSNSLQQLKRYSRNTLSDVYEDTIGSQEEILERAKQEAVVQRRVSELRKMGMWSQRRLPKVQEPPRTKAHWDYLLEEMRWLATDFAQERKWKRAAARKVVRMVAGYHKDVQERERKAEREEQQKLRRIASSVARQIRLFWSDIEKVNQVLMMLRC
ncbi:unnamed protein product [Clavelina lepadiformis]|uniref:HSA domain-containing protein n=1 Tax=Clavelina lepadiformis TaxID=159417 RepID=A0ABP0FLK2_CLALP